MPESAMQPVRPFCLWLLPVIIIGLVTESDSETINFYNPPGQTNLTSANQPMDGSFVFQLGVFKDGFIPSRNNIHQWTSKWAVAMPAAYDTGTKAFEEFHSVLSNADPFFIGTAAYVWGKRSGTSGDEWILFRNSNWSWPSPSEINPFPLDWNAAEADQVIIGSINGPGHLMKSEAVVSYSQWQSTALADEVLNGANDDPDHDGTSNLLEFVFGSLPKQASPPPQTPVEIVEIGGQFYQQIAVPRLRERSAILTVMVSDDLEEWFSGSSHTVTVSSNATSLVVRDLTPVSPSEPKRFMKVKVHLP